MIRLSWLQLRAQALLVAAVLAVIAVVLAITGPHLVHLYDTTVATCQAHNDCAAATRAMLNDDRFLQAALNPLVLVAPALTGIFWGAPLIARELEAGTFRLAWTQSISRTRWLAVKLGLAGVASVAVAGLLSWMVTWWSGPFDRVNANRLTPALFGERGLAPAGYAAAAFMLGAAAGVLIRRTVPAMAAGLVAFVGARLAMTYWGRPNLAARVHTTSLLQVGPGSGPSQSGTGPPGAWVLSNGDTINAAGRMIGQNGGIGPQGNIGFEVRGNVLRLVGAGRCPNRIPGGIGARANTRQMSGAMQECVSRLRIRELLTYQPAGRFWPFQWYELAIFLGLALALAGLCFWWVRRRLA